MPKSSTESSSSDEDESKDKMSKKHSRTSTIPMVNKDAVEILEEFLKKHQESLKDVTPMHSLYQKVSELEINEEKQSFQRSQSYRAASHESLLSNEGEVFKQSVMEEILTPTAPLASDEDSDSHVDSPVSAPEATYYKRKSSADSSSSDSSEWSRDKRHKKSFFKRARERLRITLKLQKKNKKEREEKENKIKKKKRKKGKKSGKNGKVLSEVTTVTKTHIRQSCTISDIPSKQSEITLRQGDVWESKDIKDKSGIFKHVKAHLKIKESTDSNATNGITSSFKKLKSLHRNGRKTLSLGRKAMEEDEIDGAVGGVIDSDQEDKKDMYKRVASKLAIMADEYFQSDSEGACSATELQMPENSELTPLEKEIVEHLLSIPGTHQFPSGAAMEILKQLTYNNFKQIVDGYTKDKHGVQELAALFMFSKCAINIVGAGRALASQVKDLTLRYFEDKFAAYIVEKGGWDSVLEDTDEDTESKDAEQK